MEIHYLKWKLNLKMNEQITIYGLFDPRTDECFYIGKAVNIKKRIIQHFSKDINDPNLHKKRKIQQIKNDGLDPVVKEIYKFKNYTDITLKEDGVPFRWWEYVEIFYINYYKEVLKQPLTNISKGGGGGSNLKAISQFTKEGTFIKTFDSILEASEELHISKSGISGVLGKVKKSSGGYQWCYVGDENNIKKHFKLKSGQQFRKPVSQFTKDGVFVKTYMSATEASDENNVSRGCISSCCNGNSQSAGEYQWCYVNEENNIKKYENSNFKSVSQFTSEGEYIKTHNSIMEASKETKIGYGGINACCHNRTKSAGGYQWCFPENENNMGKCKTDDRKPVSQFTLEGKYVKAYRSISEASKETKIKAVGSCCRGKVKSAGGYQWCYSGEENKIKIYKNSHSKSISQFTLSGEYIKTFNTIKEVCVEYGIDNGCLTHICKRVQKSLSKGQKSAGGYQWCYKGDEDKIKKYVNENGHSYYNNSKS